MSEKLTNPNLPAGAIIENFDDGSAIRNDGVELQAANTNPWYVLATVFGEQPDDATIFDFDGKLAAKNRRAWNGWFCGDLSEAEREERAEKVKLDPAELIALSTDELAEIRNLFKKRMRAAGVENPKIPVSTHYMDFSKVNFLKLVCFKRFIFEKAADFRSAVFSGDAYFGSAVFKAKTYFRRAKFSKFVPQFFAAEMYEDTTFSVGAGDLKYWPPIPDDSEAAEQEKRAYNRLRLFMNKGLQIDEEQFFHRQEMRAKKQTEVGLTRWLFAGFEVVSDYGHSVRRPACWLVMVIMAGWALVLYCLAPATYTGFAEALGWSISNTLPFLGFGKTYSSGFAGGLSVWLKFAGGLQTISGFILLFLLGLGLRNKFRLR